MATVKWYNAKSKKIFFIQISHQILILTAHYEAHPVLTPLSNLEEIATGSSSDYENDTELDKYCPTHMLFNQYELNDRTRFLNF